VAKISGGGDRSWLRPLQSGENKEIIGAHRGICEAMNVKNPQPNRHYYYARHDSNAIQRKLNEGWRPIRGDDPERWGADINTDEYPELDGLKARKDVILMWTDSDNYRRIQNEKARKNKVAIEGTEEEYMDRGHERAAQFGSYVPSDDLYFRTARHGRRVE
jgi:hypothetical protein